ncbi:unnamed protein product [Sphenostylis stenocarpa]|uniref:Transmembrane protein n=1 Tax=Sphenostylis stenocarpa TaxID=92480 RepID=A0AA86T264_9FABA|nr:unnamed protein product [Sphenostylis stenocarpa]
MNSIPRSRSLSFILLALSSHFILGFSNDSPASKDSTKTEHHAHAPKSTSTSTIIAIALIALVLFSLFSFGLFKLWRKKKREEQYARLLKLFEEDDELELELGLRD